MQTPLWEPKDYNKPVLITGLHGRNKSFPLCFAFKPPQRKYLKTKKTSTSLKNKPVEQTNHFDLTVQFNPELDE